MQVSFKYERLASPFTCAYCTREILNETCVYKTQVSFKYEMRLASRVRTSSGGRILNETCVL